MTASTGRVLITGSRDWDDVDLLEFQLRIACAKYLPSAIVVVHGDCPSGADRYAEAFARRQRIRTEPHAAEWQKYGASAGPRRNAHMVSLGADLCLAFNRECTKTNCRQPRPHGSHGTQNCMELAEQAGIPVRRFTR